MPLRGLVIPTPADFDQHPDYHTIVSFFIGWVFIVSLFCISSTSAAKSLAHAFFYKRTPRWFNDSGTSSVKVPSDVESEVSSISPSKRDSRTLLLIMFLAFATGSLANFVSLLSFDSSSGLCDFVVAWGELSLLTARLMGLLVLLFALRQMGIARWECIVFVVWLLVGLVFIFFNTAVATGVTVKVNPSIFFCYRKHFLPASLVTSVLYLLLEMVALGRFWFLISSENPSQSRRWRDALLDMRVLRTLSLFLLDGLTVVPSAIVTNVLGEFIPLSIGSIIVLVAFNTQNDDPPIPSMISASFDFRSAAPPSIPERLLTHQIRSPPSGVPPVILYNHPYSAVLLKDSSLLNAESPASLNNAITPSIDGSLKHQPNNSLGLTIDVNRRPSSQISIPLSTGRSDVYPASVMSSRVVTATRHKAQPSSERARPKLFIVTNPAVGPKPKSLDQGTLELSAPLKSRFSFTTTKSETASTISYPNPMVLDIDSQTQMSVSQPNSEAGHNIIPSGSERLDSGYSEVIQSNMARRSRRVSNEPGRRPLPRVP